MEIIRVKSDSTQFSKKNLVYDKTFKTAKQCKSYLKEFLLNNYENGFITARFDSIREDSLHIVAWFFQGEKYVLKSLSKGNISNDIVNESGINKLMKRNRSFSQKHISTIFEKTIQWAENNGYPFAEISLDSIFIDSTNVEAALHLNLNKKVSIDSLVFKTKLRVAPAYIYHLIGIKPGDEYNEKLIRDISKRIIESQFLKEVKGVETGFFNSNATLYLYLDKQKNNQFDGILGLLPNNENTGKIMLTGDIRLKLVNVFARAETIDLNWRKLELSSQDLKVGFNYPYLFNTPFGVDFNFSLYKKDTLYLNLNTKLGIQYLFTPNHWIKAVYTNRSSSMLSNSGFENATHLPSYLDYGTDMYGLEYRFSSLDYYFNPTKGFSLNASASGGTRKIKRNAAVNPVLYDSLQMKTSIFDCNLDASYFLPLMKRTTLLFRSTSAKIFNNNILENEQFRIGGLKSLKGFDEESIVASTYSMLNVEFRYLLDLNSYFGIYWNGAYYEGKTSGVFKHDLPWGVGLGLSFDTRAGIFSVYYSLGAENNTALQFKNSKIHFGLVSLF
ncbi:MAG: hypothetical protein WCH34_13105 [Bacteroidota bacterium]